jgi:quercetin dioxygenase-like cupin family protein
MKILSIGCVIVLASVASALAQQANIKRTVIHTFDYPPGYSTVTAIVEIGPGSCSGRHTHPGIDSGFVVEGDLVLKVEGMPDQMLKAGAGFEAAPYKPHDACTVSGVKTLDTWVIEKGKPLASPAP